MKKLLLMLILLAAVLILIGGAGIQIWYAMQNQKAADLAGAEYLAQGPIVGWRIVCDGMVDPIDGKVEIASEVVGVIDRVEVVEGARVHKDDVLAVIRGDRQAAEVSVARAELALAEANLERLEIGTGSEERGAARAKVRAAEEELTYARNELERLRDLSEGGVISADEFDGKQQRVRALESQVESLRKEAAAVQRGAFREELLTAEAEVEMVRRKLERAQLELDKCTVRAPSDGVVLELHRHAGDHVTASNGTPILSFANTDRLQIRAEIVEGDVYEVFPGLEGRFMIPGIQGGRSGKLVVNRILPDFQNRRLMMTDTRIPVDARTTVALCDVPDPGFPIYPGQRVTVSFIYTPQDQRGETGAGDAAEAVATPGRGGLRGVWDRVIDSRGKKSESPAPGDEAEAAAENATPEPQEGPEAAEGAPAEEATEPAAAQATPQSAQVEDGAAPVTTPMPAVEALPLNETEPAPAAPAVAL